MRMSNNPSSRYHITPLSRPGFTRYTRLHEDCARGRFVLLAPERAYELDPISLEVLQNLDGVTMINNLCQKLSEKFVAPIDIITGDVLKLLQGLADKRLLQEGRNPLTKKTASGAKRNGAVFLSGPTGLLAELTHRCPLQCPYCSNPLELERVNSEMSAIEWAETFRQAASIGALQLHLSGGEPTARRDLEDILGHAVEAGLYTNLITSAVLLTREQLTRLANIGLDHIQISIQDVVEENSDLISGYKGALAKKRAVANWARELGIGLTINAPMHRQNIMNLKKIIDFSVEVDAQRIEIAHIQYYAWAQKNRAALIPTQEIFLETVSIVEAAKQRLIGVLNFDFVIHDHYASRPKKCTGGWGQSIIVVTPSGKALPCHAAQTLPGLKFDNVKGQHLLKIWEKSSAFNAYRGLGWMKEPCRSCDRREIDYGGCRCQAYAFSQDPAATDPACALSAEHDSFAALAEQEAHAPAPAFIYRRYDGLSKNKN